MDPRVFRGVIVIGICLLVAEATLLTSPQRGTAGFGGGGGTAAPLQSVPLPSGPASISGTVLRSDDRTPIGGAEIRATGTGGMGTTTTDASGRFAFKDVAEGIYTISARRDGFFGTTTSGAANLGQITTVVTTATQPNASVEMLLLAGATISGRVTYANGTTASAARISAMRFRYAGQETTLAGIGNAITDADGNFRIPGIEPGDVYLRAAVVRNAAGESIPPTVTYFPSEREYSAGSRLTATAGLELTADIQLVEGIRRRVSGRLFGADPSAPVAAFALLPQGPTVDSLEVGTSRNGAAADGSFQIETMRPGVYDVIAYTNSSSGRARVDLRNQDASDVSLTLMPTVELDVQFTGQQAESYTRGGIALAPVDTPLPTLLRPRSMTGFAGRGQTSQTFTGITAGKYSLTIANHGNAGTYIADIVQGGKSILESGVITIGAEKPPPVEVRTAAGGGVIEGTVQMGADTSTSAVVLIAVPEGLRRQNSLLYARVLLGLARSSTPAHGSFRISGMTPGRYKVFAFGNNPEPFSEQNADFMKPYEQFGIPVEVNLEGTAAAITVPLIPTSK